MKKISQLGIVAIALGAFACKHEQAKEISYPETRKASTSYQLFGTEIKDPYAWLEDDYSEETMAWVDKQNEVTRSYLDELPARTDLLNKMPKYWDFESYGLPKRTKAGLIYSYTDGKMNQPVIKLMTNGQEKVLLNPNTFSKDGTASLSSYSVSNDGKYLAFGMSKSGSDWVDIKVMEIESGMLLDDEVNWVKFSGITWDDKGFYYSAFPAPKDGNTYSAKNEFHRVYYHEIGKSEDVLVYEDAKNAQRTFGSFMDKDKKYLFVSGAESTSGNSVHFKKLDGAEGFKTMVSSFENDYSYIGNHKGGFLFLSNYQAPNNQILWVSPEKPEQGNWETLVAQSENLLQGVEMVKGGLILNYLSDVVNKVFFFEFESGDLREIKAPGIGNISGIEYDKDQDEVYFSYESYIQPKSIYKLSSLDGEMQAFKALKLPFNPSDFEVSQHFYLSKDGTRVPIFLTHKKGLEKSSETPCFLYAYGGFNISIQPHFKPDRMAFLNDGGIYAVANIRGGSEYGEAWHEEGTKLQKQNVFDDFISAAEWLQKEGYTSKEKLAVHGRSNGGLLIGAVLTQRPDLFQVALPKVGVLDMLKYHQFTIGWAWAADYGRSDESREMFEYLHAYSPVHNVKPLSYPATMVITGDHDDRVVPAHSFKFAAMLQEYQQGSEPVLLRVDKNAGHGAGKPVEKQVEEFADQWAFVYHHLGM